MIYLQLIHKFSKRLYLYAQKKPLGLSPSLVYALHVLIGVLGCIISLSLFTLPQLGTLCVFSLIYGCISSRIPPYPLSLFLNSREMMKNPIPSESVRSMISILVCSLKTPPMFASIYIMICAW